MRTIWISNQVNAKVGTGTQTDPFNGSDLKFDAIFRDSSKIPREPCNIQLVPSALAYLTDAFERGWSVLPGWTIFGNNSILQATALKAAVPYSRGYYCAIGTTTDITDQPIIIRDLIVDANFNYLKQFVEHQNNEPFATFNGISLLGNNTIAEGCQVLNFGGSLANGMESGAITIGGPNARNVTARRCIVRNPLGNYQNAFNVWALTGNQTSPIIKALVEDCEMYGGNSQLGWNIGSAINTGGVHKFKAIRNHAEDTNQFVYNDTGDSEDYLIEDNDLIRGASGVALNQGPNFGTKIRIQVLNNRFNTQNKWNFTTCGLTLQSAESSDILFARNQITHTHDPKAAPDSFQVFYCFLMNNAFFHDNISDVPVQQPFVEGQDVKFFRNRQPNGQIIYPSLQDNMAVMTPQ